MESLSSPDFQARGAAILFLSLQLAVFFAIAAYLSHCRAGLQRRNARSWDAIVRLLLAGSSGDGASVNFAVEIDRRFTNQSIEQRVGSPRGRRTMFRDAGVMMEMADYAERNGGERQALFVTALRRHALAIRIGTLRDFVRRGE